MRGCGLSFNPGIRRQSLGVASIKGDNISTVTKENIWGGQHHPIQILIISYAIISIAGNLYMWVSPGTGSNCYEKQQVWKSVNHGESWTKENWALNMTEGIINPTFLQFGKDYAGVPDNYVYFYSNHVKKTTLSIQYLGEIALLRVPKSSVMDRSKYPFFTGLDGSEDPIWTSNISSRKPVFKDANG